MQGWGAEDTDLFYRLVFLGLVRCRNPRFRGMTVPHRPEVDHVFTTISLSNQHHTRGQRVGTAVQLNEKRAYQFEKTGLSATVASTGGWKQSKYHVEKIESWPSLPPQRFGGFAEIHHIRLKVDKASLELCFVNCDEHK